MLKTMLHTLPYLYIYGAYELVLEMLREFLPSSIKIKYPDPLE